MKKITSLLLLFTLIISILTLSSCSKEAPPASKKENKEKLFSHGLVNAYNETGGGYLNEKGEVAITFRYQKAYPFAECGLALVKENNLYGYINPKGEYVIEPTYSQATEFDACGFAVVLDGAQYAYIGADGKYLTEAIFSKAYPFSECGVARVRVDSKYRYINRNGEYINDMTFGSCEDFDENGFAKVSKGSKWGYLHKDGTLVGEIKYDELGDFSAGVARVTLDKKHGYIDEKGNEILAPTFTYASDFFDCGVAYVKDGDAIGFINTKGNYIIEPRDNMDISYDMHDGIGYCIYDNTVHYFNAKGKVILEKPWQDSVAPNFENGYLTFAENGGCSVYNAKGKRVLRTDYDSISPFKENGIANATKGETEYLIDSKGNVLFETNDYQISVESLDSKVFSLYKNNLFGVLSPDGTVLVEPTYLQLNAWRDYITFRSYDTTGYGILDLNGNVLLAGGATSITPYQDDYILATAERGAYIVRLDGTVLDLRAYGSINEKAIPLFWD